MKLAITFDSDEEKNALQRFIPEGVDLSNVQISEVSVARRILMTLRIIAVRVNRKLQK